MRPLTWLRVAYGSLLLAAPRTLTRALPTQRLDSRAVAFARLLGARQLVEAAILGRTRSPVWLLAGAAVDATHSATMLAFAVARPNRRSLAIANAIAAAAIATAGVIEARHQPDPPGAAGRR